MEQKKCSTEGHEEIEANYYCPLCKIYICKQCESFHSKLFKNHKICGLDKDSKEIFTGFCQVNNHFEKLDYYCKSHNKLCCSSCIVKLKREGKGQHANCDICLIEDIKNQKNDTLKQNIIYLENLNNKIDKSIDEVKEMFNQINKDKEMLKLKITNIFTEIKNKINEREDLILLEVDKLYDKTYIQENKTKDINKLPKMIKTSLEKGKISEEDWTNKDQLSFVLHNCINLEKDISYINEINQAFQKMKNLMEVKIKFSPEEKGDINDILNKISNFGKIYKENNNINEKNIINFEINSLTQKDKQFPFSIEFGRFTKMEYTNYYPENTKYNDDEIVISFCLEAKNEKDVDSLSNIFEEFFFNKLENNLIIKTEIRKNKCKLFLDIRRKFEGEEDKDLLQELYLKLFKYFNISLNFKSNFIFNEFSKMSFEEFILNFFSFAFNGKFNIIELNEFKEKMEKEEKQFKEENKKEEEENVAIFFNNFISILKKINFEISFSPETLLMKLKEMGNEVYNVGDMKLLKEEIKIYLNYINKSLFKDVLKYLKLEKFAISLLFSKDKSGLYLDINSNGLTNAINELIS